MRLFIALDVSEEIRARVAEAVARERTTVDAKWARTEGLHLTLVFFGQLSLEKVPEIVAAAAAAKCSPLQLEIYGAGTFGEKQPRVLWLGVRGDVAPLGPMAERISEQLGVVREHPQYTPHLTLARSVTPRGDPMLEEVAQRLGRKSFGAWTVDHLTVYESVGGRYRPLANIPLRG